MGRRVAGASKSMFDDMAVAACTDSSRMIGTIIVVWGGPRVRPGPGCPPAGRRTTHNNGCRKDRHPPTAYIRTGTAARAHIPQPAGYQDRKAEQRTVHRPALWCAAAGRQLYGRIGPETTTFLFYDRRQPLPPSIGITVAHDPHAAPTSAASARCNRCAEWPGLGDEVTEKVR